MSPDNAPSRPLPLRLLVGIASAPVQWVLAVGWMWTCTRLWPAEQIERAKVRALGLRMYENRVGDQLLREKVTTLKNKEKEPNLQRKKRTELRSDLDKGYYALGNSALDATVPMILTDKEYPAAQGARDRMRKVRGQADSLAGQIWPTHVLGWLGLVFSYALVGYLVWIAVSALWLTTAVGTATRSF